MSRPNKGELYSTGSLPIYLGKHSRLTENVDFITYSGEFIILNVIYFDIFFGEPLYRLKVLTTTGIVGWCDSADRMNKISL